MRELTVQTTAPTTESIERLRALAEDATPGPWAWFGYVPAASGRAKCRELHLATVRWGRHYIMTFDRWGWSGAAPNFRDAERGTMRPAEQFADSLPHSGEITGMRSPDAQWMAAASPDVVLGLLDALSAANARLAEAEAERDQARAERDYDERIAAEALRALAIAVRRAEGVEAMRDVLRADLRADRLALARLQEAGGVLAELLAHCRTTDADERRAGIARWAEALAGGPETAQGEAQPEAEAARPGHTIPLRLPDAPRPRTGGAGCAGAGYGDED